MPVGMSAVGGRADVICQELSGPFIARSGHSSIPHLTPKVQEEITSVTVDESQIPLCVSFFWLHLSLSWVRIAAAIKTRQGESASKARLSDGCRNLWHPKGAL